MRTIQMYNHEKVVSIKKAEETKKQTSDSPD